jgi:MFS family permease
MWMLWGQYFFLSFGWYFYITWLPDYLRTERGLELKSNAVMKWLASVLEGWLSADMTTKVLAAVLLGIPLLFGGFGSLIAGIISSRWLKRGGSVTFVRRLFGFVGMTGAAALVMVSFYFKDPLYTMLAIGFASLFNDLTIPGSWATCMDVGGKYAGTVSGSMNMMGNFGGMASPWVVGWVLDLTHRDWRLVFIMYSVAYFVGAFCWLFVNPHDRLEKAGQTPTHNPS